MASEPKVIATGSDKEPFTFTLPAGSYYVGDPCYVLDDLYRRIHEMKWGGDKPPSVGDRIIHLEVPTPAGPAQMVCWGTLVGDGRFPYDAAGMPGCSTPPLGLAVDSGQLSLVGGRLIEKRWGGNADAMTGAIHTNKPIAVTIDGGVLTAEGGRFMIAADTPDESA